VSVGPFRDVKANALTIREENDKVVSVTDAGPAMSVGSSDIIGRRRRIPRRLWTGILIRECPIGRLGGTSAITGKHDCG